MPMEPVDLPIVDVDVPATWPAPLVGLVGELAEAARRSGHAPENYQDLDLLPYEGTAWALLEGHLGRARHHTRLLDHEKDAIRAQGLRLLDAQLVKDRLDQAHALGYLTAQERERLQTVNETVPGQHGRGRREGQVCLTLSAAAQLHHIHGIHRLLTYWGGEAIYWQHCEGSPGLADKLRSLGVPSVVTVLLDLAAPGQQRPSIFPSLVHVFVGKALGHDPADADVFYKSPIPPQRIESIVSPGDAAYDRFPDLPRS
ncbi:hypothetical protein [Streptomyces microflavus]|uniref:hypothetical protein n=1 Tax=Streptomyces microflavus TaxID=1919 RepID=UPI00386FEDE9|nr:hypothetical protein OG721_00090 [Streptomyces microflavus]WST19573.1 hypothetical protein OG721_39010 [Streptomyces microflavus]